MLPHKNSAIISPTNGLHYEHSGFQVYLLERYEKMQGSRLQDNKANKALLLRHVLICGNIFTYHNIIDITELSITINVYYGVVPIIIGCVCAIIVYAFSDK